MRFRYHGRLWEVRLLDDGTLDTVVSIRPVAKSRRDLNTSGFGDPDYEYPTQEQRFTEVEGVRDSRGIVTGAGLLELGRMAADEYQWPEEPLRYGGRGPLKTL